MVFTSLALAYFLFSPPDAPNLDQGKATYRSNCAFCHGLGGLGGRGPDLVTQPLPDPDIKRIIREGVPGTSMPSFGGFDDADLNKVIAFVKHLGGSAPAGQKVAGDPAHGKEVYAKNGCAGCHLIGAEGSTYGPNLTRVGGARPATYLRESIVDPSADVPPEHEGVTVVSSDGKRVRGIRVNQDSFSVQLRLPSQQFRSFAIGRDAKEIVNESKSLMPAYTQLPPADLQDLVSYLATLRARNAGGGQAKQSEGIK